MKTTPSSAHTVSDTPAHPDLSGNSVHRQLFEATFRSQRDAILVLDDGDSPRITNANPAAVRMFGYSERELCDLAVDRLFVDSANSPFSNQLRWSIVEYGFCDLSDCVMVRKDGSRFPTEYSVTPLKDDDERHTGWLLVVRDITTRKYQENLLRESESRYRNLTESSPDAILVFQNSRIVFCNEAAWHLLGAGTQKELLGKALDDFTPSDPDGRRLSLIALCSEAELPRCHTERRITRLDGKLVIAEVAVRQTVYFGKPALQVVAHDTSEQKVIERKLRETTRDLEHERELLTSKNAALREVISQIDNEKQNLRSQIQSNVERIIHPLLRSLTVHLEPSGQEYLALLQSHLDDLVSPFVRRLDRAAERLSPRELEISNLISQGMTSKDIARLLGISEHTVLKLRQRVRRKLNLTNADVNLSTYLTGLRDNN